MTTSTIRPASEASTDRCENEGGPARSAGALARENVQSELKRYGITPVQLTVYNRRGYRFTNSKYAIAAAKPLASSS